MPCFISRSEEGASSFLVNALDWYRGMRRRRSPRQQARESEAPGRAAGPSSVAEVTTVNKERKCTGDNPHSTTSEAESSRREGASSHHAGAAAGAGRASEQQAADMQVEDNETAETASAVGASCSDEDDDLGDLVEFDPIDPAVALLAREAAGELHEKQRWRNVGASLVLDSLRGVVTLSIELPSAQAAHAVPLVQLGLESFLTPAEEDNDEMGEVRVIIEVSGYAVPSVREVVFVRTRNQEGSSQGGGVSGSEGGGPMSYRGGGGGSGGVGGGSSRTPLRCTVLRTLIRAALAHDPSVTTATLFTFSAGSAAASAAITIAAAKRPLGLSSSPNPFLRAAEALRSALYAAADRCPVCHRLHDGAAPPPPDDEEDVDEEAGDDPDDRSADAVGAAVPRGRSSFFASSGATRRGKRGGRPPRRSSGIAGSSSSSAAATAAAATAAGGGGGGGGTQATSFPATPWVGAALQEQQQAAAAGSRRRLDPAIVQRSPTRQLRACPPWDPNSGLCLEAFENDWRPGSLAVGIAPLLALAGGSAAAVHVALASCAAECASSGVTQASQVMEPFPSFLLSNREPTRGRAGVLSSSALPITAHSRLSNVQNKQPGLHRLAAALKLLAPWEELVAAACTLGDEGVIELLYLRQMRERAKEKRMAEEATALAAARAARCGAAAGSVSAADQLESQSSAALLNNLGFTPHVPPTPEAAAIVYGRAPTPRASASAGGAAAAAAAAAENGEEGEEERESAAQRALLRLGSGPGKGGDENEVYRILRFVLLSSSHVEIARVPQEAKVAGFPPQATQVAVFGAEPLGFASLARERGTFFAFHGSAVHNWFGILRNNLRVMSDTALATTGASYGPGIYCSKILSTALGYASRESIPAALARAAGLVPADCVAGASGPFCAAALLEVAAGVRENADHGRIIVAPSADHVAIRMLLIFTAADAQAATQAGYFDHENVETAMRAAAATLSFQRGGSEEGKDVTAGAEA